MFGEASWVPGQLLVSKAVGNNIRTASRRLFNALTDANKEEWAASDPRDWANESFALAKAAKMRYCVRHGTSCDLTSPAHFKIDAAHIDANIPTVREPLTKAGVRLPKLLDAALGHSRQAGLP